MQNIVLIWNEVLLEAIRQTKPGPPMAARSIAIVYTSIYDAWTAYDPCARPSVSGIATRPEEEQTPTNKEIAIHFAAFRSLSDQFPGVKQLFINKMTELGQDPTNSSTSETTAAGIGNLSANRVLAFRQEDGANEAGKYADTTGYTPKNPLLNPLFPSTVSDIPFPAYWQPLIFLSPDKPIAPAFIAPHWGSVRPFALSSGDQFRPHPPQQFTTQGFIDQARYVIDLQAHLTPTQKVIAEYWADGPRSELPPGHWMLFSAFVVERDHMHLDDTVKLFFAVSNAILDASIATWEAKRYYDYCRPITAIRYLFRGKIIQAWGGAGKGTVSLPGEMWRPFQVNTFPTPPFAEYTSGHSAFSMAAATVLKLFTHNDKFGYFYMQQKPLAADPSEEVVGIVMKWDTFTHAALDAGESRLYGGIHFYEGNVAGLEMGRKVGELVYEKAASFWAADPS